MGPMSLTDGWCTIHVSIIALPTLKCKSAGPVITALASGDISAIRLEKLLNILVVKH